MKWLLILFFFMSSSIHIVAETILPIPERISIDQKKAQLGKKLFFETGLSRDNTVACVSCHQLPGSGADKLPYSLGIRGEEGPINAPTVLNARFNFVQMWDGKVKTLKDQVPLPISKVNEMGSSMSKAVEFLKTRSDYREAFARVYRSGITEESIADAIAEFEKALVTPHSRYDRYLNGERNILSAKELKGKELFYSYGCISCHNGIAVGGNMYQKIGIFAPYYSAKNQLGRFEITNREQDRYVFKVPSLRNVALTAPYMHDGKISTLREAILVMGMTQLGVEFSDDDIEALEQFLNTLTGETPRILREDVR